MRWFVLVGLGVALGCQTPGYDRIPATAVDNPDPMLGGAAKPRQETAMATNLPGSTKPDAIAWAPKNQDAIQGTPTGQRIEPRGAGVAPDRIGPLTVASPSQPRVDSTAQGGAGSGTASLTLGVREPKWDAAEGQIRPASTFVPTANPEAVLSYRKQLNDLGAIGVKTKQLEITRWEAFGHFQDVGQSGQMRRIEAQGATEADALLAILEQLQGKKPEVRR